MTATLTKDYIHEAGDRTYAVQIMIDKLLREHPVFTNKREECKAILEKLDKADELLGEIYQDIWNIET